MPTAAAPLSATEVVITRPAGTARALARRVRARGGTPLLLPGLSLRAIGDDAACTAWQDAQRADVMIFTSPAAVRFALQLAPLDTHARLLGVGRGTRDALRRAGFPDVQSPGKGGERSEGLLDHPWLQDVAARTVAVITAPGGRDLIARDLARRGAQVRRADVYRRVRPRLSRRHLEQVMALHDDACLLVTSAQALDHLLAILPPAACERLRTIRIVVSSERLQRHAHAAGFRRIVRAASPAGSDLLDAAAVRA